MDSKIGFYLGRFQPYSLKHLEITQRILRDFPDVSLNVGVAGWKGEPTRNNFLSGDEAATIIELTLKDFSLQNRVGVKVVELYPELTVEQSITSILPNDLQVSFFSGSEKTIGALERLRDRGLPLDINILPDDDLTPPRSREIRESLLRGVGWKEMVAPSVQEYLSQFRGRLMSLPEGSLKRPWNTEVDLNLGPEHLR